MAAFKEFGNYDAVGLAELVAQKDVTPTELLETAIERVEAVNPQLNAVTATMYDEARKTIDAGPAEGPFKGVPYLLKDLYADYAGFPTTNGSNLYDSVIPDHNTTMVDRLVGSGLVVFGKTNTPEFGLTVTTEPRRLGVCRSPWNTDHSTGGSSGGASSAVGARMVPAAHASDGGGSIRIPAACGGVFGLKPTRGRISLGPDQGEGWAGMSMQHAVTISIRDSAALLDVVAGPAPGDPYYLDKPATPFAQEVGQDPGKLRIGFSTVSPAGGLVEADCVTAVQNAAKLCEGIGHSVEEAAPSYDNELMRASAGTIIQASVASTLDGAKAFLGRDASPDDVEHGTWLMAEAGRRLPAADYATAVRNIHVISRQVATFFETYDVLIMPVLAKPPAAIGYLDMNSEDVGTYIGRLFEYSPFCQMANATGQPAMSVPLHWTSDGLPVGVQFVGRYAAEATLFRLAAQLEQAQPWNDKKPPVCADAM